MDRLDPKQLVVEWQERVFNLAYRLLGNEADAADATQEVFARILENLHRFDARRPLKPWLYRVATNVILNLRRSERARKAGEARAGEAEVGVEADQSKELECKEMQEILARELAKLPEEERALLVLHYHQGLSQLEVAECLSLPRTTVQSRLKRALESLRKGLAVAGCGLAAPAVEAAMRAAPVMSVPPEVAASLAALAGAAAPGVACVGAAGAGMAGASGMALGGILMSKHLLIGAALVGLALFGTGFFTAKALSPAEGKEKRVGEPATGSRAQADARVQALRDEVETLKAENRRLAAARRDRPPADPAPSGQASGEKAEAATAGEAEAAGAIDWKSFSKKFAAVAKTVAVRGEVTDPDALVNQAEFGSELVKAARKAHQMSDAPFFDARIFPELVQALYGEALGLTEEQRAQVLEGAGALIEAQAAKTKPGEALPVELYHGRQSAIGQLGDTVRPILTPEQLQSWDEVHRAATRVLQGDSSQVALGLNDKLADSSFVLRQWEKVYALDEAQRQTAAPVAESYLEEAKGLLAQVGQLEEGASRPSKEEQARIDEAFFQLQCRMERQLQPLLTPEQRERAHRRYPVIIRFSGSKGTDISTRTSGGI